MANLAGRAGGGANRGTLGGNTLSRRSFGRVDKESSDVIGEPNSPEVESASAPLLAAAAAGDERAWRTLVDLYSRRIFALARSRCKDASVAEDITQSVFVTVAEKVGSGEYTEQGKFEPWLFRVVMNRVRDHIRRVRRRPDSPDVQAVERQTAPEQDRSDTGQLDKLRAAMERLSEADREIIEMRHHGGMSFKQMAEVLDEPMGTLLARHHRALRKLKELMEDGQVASKGEALA